MRATNETVLITGASSGIGAEAARLFAGEGYRVFGTSRRFQPDDDGVEMLMLDVRSEESIRNCVSDVLDRAGQIDILVNNAAVLHAGYFTEETSMEDAHSVFETNFFGVAKMTNAVLPGMRERRSGRIINIGSLASWVGEPAMAFYAASKNALAGYTEALRHELWPLGLHVSLLEPGYFKTNMQQAPYTTRTTISDYNAPRRAARRALREAAHEGKDPRIVADLILKIARARSPRMRYMTGRERWVPYFKVLAPQRLFDYVLRRWFGLIETEIPRDKTARAMPRPQVEV